MNPEQYIPALENTFACDVYRKGYPQNQHMQEFQLIQNERNTYTDHRHSQAASINTKQLMPAMTNPFSGSVSGGDFTQNHHWQGNCQDINQVRPFGEQGYSHIVKTSNEHMNQAVANHFPCDVYGKEFSKNSDLQECHLSHNKVQKLSCGKCKKKFAKREELNVHHCLQVSQAPFTCDICKNEFSEKSALEKHQLLHTLEQPFACAVCGSRFSTLPDLTIHVQIHSEDKPSPSKVSDKQPVSKERLKSSHSVDNTQEKRFVCDICEKRFGYKQRLDEHKLTHSDERPHACDMCQKTFKCKKHLQNHYNSVHNGEYRYTCDQCEKKYKVKQALKYHLLRHAREKPYHCDKCTRKFTRKSHLTLHQRTHTGEKPFSCPKCPVKYANREYFLKHVRSHDGQNDSQAGKINNEQRNTHSQKVSKSTQNLNKISSQVVKVKTSNTDPSSCVKEQVRWKLKFV